MYTLYTTTKKLTSLGALSQTRSSSRSSVHRSPKLYIPSPSNPKLPNAHIFLAFLALIRKPQNPIRS